MDDEQLHQPGVLLDDRPEEEQLKDFTFEEVVSSPSSVAWVEKDEEEWRSFPIYDQNGSGSCVAQTLRKMLGIYVSLKTGSFLPLSASHIYQRRFNKPGSGMMGVDAFKIAQKGTTLELFAPSEKLTDAQMDKARINTFEENIGYSFKIGNYLTITDIRNIDTIASIIQETGKGVMVWFYFASGLSEKEWTDVPEVKYEDLPLSGPNTARHSVTAVDFILYKGKKALVIEDSWGLKAAMNGRRIITEDFFQARNFFGAHFMNFAFEEADQEDPKPTHIFLRDLEFSPVVAYGDVDVIALQNILKYEGLFPSNVESTGYFGALTKQKVGEFQLKHSLVGTPSDPGYGRVGPKTRALLNNLYSK